MMGGLGSGRSFGKRTTNQLTSIKIKDVNGYDKTRGLVSFRYSYLDKPVEHNVYLTTTVCHYGGVRYWFKCHYCHRRIGVIYFSGVQCACRHCFRLAYKSERETYHDQQFRKANAVRHRLGWQPGIAHPDGPKPKGMHWKTFYHLKAKHDFHVRRILGYQQDWIVKIQSGMQVSL